MNVLSLFDGMSCGRLALERAGFKINNYYASEISLPKIKASQNYFPDNIHIGDVTKVSGKDYDIDILIGGSPCQGFSIMGDRLNFDDPRSGLIMDYFRILEESKPKYFLLENVSMDKQCEIEISRRLGVLPVKINSALVSAQNRKRVYWTNIPGTGENLFDSEILQPKDKNVILKDILQPKKQVDKKYRLSGKALIYVRNQILEYKEKYAKLNGLKSRALLEGYNSRWNGTYISDELYMMHRAHGNNPGGIKITKKTGTLTASSWQDNHLLLDRIIIRKLTPVECCRLQTVPDDFFDGSDISDNQQYSCLGDGWTVDVICHILNGLK